MYLYYVRADLVFVFFFFFSSSSSFWSFRYVSLFPHTSLFCKICHFTQTVGKTVVVVWGVSERERVCVCVFGLLEYLLIFFFLYSEKTTAWHGMHSYVDLYCYFSEHLYFLAGELSTWSCACGGWGWKASFQQVYLASDGLCQGRTLWTVVKRAYIPIMYFHDQISILFN